MVNPVKFSSHSSSLITVQNLFALCHIACAWAYVGGRQNFTLLLGVGVMPDSLGTHLHTCYAQWLKWQLAAGGGGLCKAGVMLSRGHNQSRA